MTTAQLDAGLTRAFDAFLRGYQEWGGHEFAGFVAMDSPENYQGPLIWSEGDAQFRLAVALEHEFPRMVHLEVPLARYSRTDFVRGQDRVQFIDIVVSDLSTFTATEKQVFGARTHELFIEVKYVGHSRTRQFAKVGHRTIRNGVKADVARLVSSLQRKRCRAAAMLLIDDNSYLEQIGWDADTKPWSPKVRPLLASPTQLARWRRARDVGVALPAYCTACGSPRVAPVLFGEPTAEMQDAAGRFEVVAGGCETRGDNLDPKFECVDCHANDQTMPPHAGEAVPAPRPEQH